MRFKDPKTLSLRRRPRPLTLPSLHSPLLLPCDGHYPVVNYVPVASSVLAIPSSLPFSSCLVGMGEGLRPPDSAARASLRPPPPSPPICCLRPREGRSEQKSLKELLLKGASKGRKAVLVERLVQVFPSPPFVPRRKKRQGAFRGSGAGGVYLARMKGKIVLLP